MFLLSTSETILILVFVVSTMLGVGMHTRVSDLRSLIRTRGLLARVLLANFVVIPLVGVVLVLVLPLQPHVAGALVLLACTPGGASAVQFTTKIQGSSTLAGAVMGMLSLLSVFLSPLILKLLLPASVALVIPYGNALAAFLLFFCLPVLAGMALLGKAPGAAEKLSKLLTLAGLVAFVAFMVVTGDARQAAAGEIGSGAVGAMLLLIAIAMAVGWIMGGPSRESRQVVATSTSMRNAALCLAIVERSSPGSQILLPLIAFSLLMVPANLLFSIYGNVQAKRRARHAKAVPP